MNALRWMLLTVLLTQAAMCGNKGPLVVPEREAREVLAR